MWRAAAGVALLQGTPPPVESRREVVVEQDDSCKHVMWSFTRLQLLL